MPSPETIRPSTPKADPQAETDTRGILLHRVGIDRVIYPARISGWEQNDSIEQRTQATFSLSVSLAAEKRGIHMSRLITHGISPSVCHNSHHFLPNSATNKAPNPPR
jgi:GTP cyclohydrolase FolE2